MKAGTRVQIPAYTDAWMRGDRYGEVIAIVGKDQCRARVRLDKSRKVMCILISDLREV
jgi:hypothetical protein